MMVVSSANVGRSSALREEEKEYEVGLLCFSLYM